MARRKPAAVTISVRNRDRLINRLRTFETAVQQKIAREAASRTIKSYVHPRLQHGLSSLDGMDVTADALEQKLLPKRKYRNGATLQARYKKVIRLYKQRYGDEPAAKKDEGDYAYYYPWVLEFGRPNMAARMPFRNAARSQRGRMKRVFRKELAKELKRARKPNYGD